MLRIIKKRAVVRPLLLSKHEEAITVVVILVEKKHIELNAISWVIYSLSDKRLCTSTLNST